MAPSAAAAALSSSSYREGGEAAGLKDLLKKPSIRMPLSEVHLDEFVPGEGHLGFRTDALNPLAQGIW